MSPLIHYIRRSLQSTYSTEESKTLALWICCDLLGVNAVDIYMDKDITLSDSDRCKLENIMLRLQKHEPMQYICGYASFCGNRFRVGPGVLIPRPETQELAELLLKENQQAKSLLDIGTGSGCLAITFARYHPEAKVKAWDVSDKALECAQWNNKHLGTNVTFEKHDILAETCSNEHFDLIVSNPPYVMESEKAQMEANVLNWEPGEALFVPDRDPLLFYRHIAIAGNRLLAPKGKIYLEINQKCGPETARLLETCHYKEIRVIKDSFGNDRIVTASL